MTGHDPGGTCEYEFTIAGGLGPVLRWALRPGHVVESHTSTTFRTTSAVDMPALVAQLDSFGLRIEELCLIRQKGRENR